MGKDRVGIHPHRFLWDFHRRLAKGAHLIVEQTKLNDEVWLPKRVNIRYDARLALLKHQADSWILSVTEQ